MSEIKRTQKCADMSRPPEKYANMPNLWQVACELAKFKDPYKACDILLALAGPMLKEAGAA